MVRSRSNLDREGGEVASGGGVGREVGRGLGFPPWWGYGGGWVGRLGLCPVGLASWATDGPVGGVPLFFIFS